LEILIKEQTKVYPLGNFNKRTDKGSHTQHEKR